MLGLGPVWVAERGVAALADASWVAGISSPATASTMVKVKRSLLRRTTWVIFMVVLLGMGGMRLR